MSGHSSERAPARSVEHGPDARDVDLVFEGGGLKGIALVGAYSVLEERGYITKESGEARNGKANRYRLIPAISEPPERRRMQGSSSSLIWWFTFAGLRPSPSLGGLSSPRRRPTRVCWL